MMNKEIIIDGVDISKCSEYCGTHESINGEIHHNCFRGDCTDKPYCYYKQLNRQMDKNKKLRDKQQVRKLIYRKLETAIENIDSFANKINKEIIEYKRVLKELDGE